MPSSCISTQRGGLSGNGFNAESAKLLKRYGGRYLLYDGDEAGVRATERAAERAGRTGWKRALFRCPAGWTRMIMCGKRVPRRCSRPWTMH